MWFRRWFRRRRQPPPALLPSLERLTELIDRVVELLDERPPARPPERPPAAAPAPVAVPAPPRVDRLPDPGPSLDGHLLFLCTPDGYRLLAREGPPPARGDLLEAEEARFAVLRLGPSPLPEDRRRCAYLERQEPPTTDRTFER
jgi:hypothetical protein